MDDPGSLILASFPTILSDLILEPFFIIGMVSMLVLLIFSALISGSEMAFFSISSTDIDEIKTKDSNKGKIIAQLLEEPKTLLATVLIANNFVNVAIVILSTLISNKALSQANNPVLQFVIQVLLVTFLILLIGEVIPKIYASSNARKFAEIMAYPMVFLKKLFRPLSFLLVSSTSFIDKRVKQKGHNISVDDLSHALELTTDEETSEHEHKILKGIVKFGNIEVKQIMRSRVNVTAFDYDTDFKTLLTKIVESGFSRVPVYKETFDSIAGTLYIKDLLPYLNESADFKWQKLLRTTFFIPENKKIDELLNEFKEKKIHLAVAIDEYGGTSGIVTLEDVMEEIVGEISDEFDDDELNYSKLDENNYVFEGKIHLTDLYRVLKIDSELFEAAKGESDTLAGFILELGGKIPAKNTAITFHHYTFTIEAADNRRIKMVKVSINRPQSVENNA